MLLASSIPTCYSNPLADSLNPSEWENVWGIIYEMSNNHVYRGRQ